MEHPNVHLLRHPLVEHHLAALRDRDTGPSAFRALVRRLTLFLIAEATRDLPTEAVEVVTPVATAACRRVTTRIGVVPILRAGMGMVDPILEILPGAEVWHLGCYRDEQTLEPVEYYRKFTGTPPVSTALIADPMLATGGSATAALQAIDAWGVQDRRLLVLIAAPEGIARVLRDFPETQIYVCAVDDYLNEKAYIVPGLGDAGDRLFNAQAD